MVRVPGAVAFVNDCISRELGLAAKRSVAEVGQDYMVDRGFQLDGVQCFVVGILDVLVDDHSTREDK